MLKSKINDENTDFIKIIKSEHIENITNEIENNFSKYFEEFVNNDSLQKLSNNLNSVKNKNNYNSIIKSIFIKSIDEYNKEREYYTTFFNNDDMQDYRDDPKTFKNSLSKKCPIIRKCSNSKRPELMEWKKKFILTDSDKILETFINLLDFKDYYYNSIYDEKKYKDFNNLDNFDKFNSFSEDIEFSIIGVMGMGIKSTVLYYFHPNVFPHRGRHALYGLYFLSNKKFFNLRSKSSEFLMIDDTKNTSNNHNCRMDQNYWYPYSLFLLYSLRIYRMLKEKCLEHNVHLDDENRYIYVEKFFKSVCEYNQDTINTMLGGDEE